MAEQHDGAATVDERVVMQSLVRGKLAKSPEFARTMSGVAVCRLLVLGKAAGPASAPPRVSLYIRGGGDLRVDEAERCAFNLHEGDLIEAVGDIGPERLRAPRQEVIVTEQVKLWARSAGVGVAA